MKFHNPESEVYVPDDSPADHALLRTTHLAVGAHQDDLEIMAFHGILECFGKSDKHFTGVTVTNGSGSPRDDLYKGYTDEEMRKVRRVEQKKAAFVGEYSAHVFLDYPSSAVKDGKNTHVVEDLKKLVAAAKPQIIYTHNLADKHDTHVGTLLRLIRAVRELPADERPARLYGCEVWRDLDWMVDKDKVVFVVDTHENLAASLVGIFDSQICGGKRYDLATMARRRANATYFESHATDKATSVIFGIDLTPLIQDAKLQPTAFIGSFIDRFAGDVSSRIAKLS
ncbi:MAG: PIG-L family deacetylase [Acidobacteria bacterium]|nr:PIG-L family deacetylase [Acidobacteriota bacterium]